MAGCLLCPKYRPESAGGPYKGFKGYGGGENPAQMRGHMDSEAHRKAVEAHERVPSRVVFSFFARAARPQRVETHAEAAARRAAQLAPQGGGGGGMAGDGAAAAAAAAALPVPERNGAGGIELGDAAGGSSESFERAAAEPAACSSASSVGDCPGVSVAYLFDSPFCLNFPVALPVLHQENIDVNVVAGNLRSRLCMRSATPLTTLRPVPDAAGKEGAAQSCTHCARLLTASWLKDAASRSKILEVDWLPFTHHTFAQQRATSQRRRASGRAMSLVALSVSRRLVSAHARVELHDKLLHAMADGSVPRLSALVAAALRAGRGPAHIAHMIAQAKAGKYHAKGFSMAERDIMLLVLRLGHRGLTYAVAHALGLPSITTALEHSAKGDATGIIVSHSSFAVEEGVVKSLARVIDRMNATYRNAGLPLNSAVPSLLNDATVVTSGAGCAQGFFTGLCQCNTASTEVTDYAGAVNLANAVKKGTIHLAKNVNVIGIVDLAGVHHGVEEVHVAGVCGAANAAWNAGVLTMVERAWRTVGGEDAFGPFPLNGRDGAAPLRAALMLRTLEKPALPRHPRVCTALKLLETLPGFGVLLDAFGAADITDHRHILKRVLTDWAASGVQVGSKFLPVSVLRFIVAAGLGKARSSSHVDTIFSLEDKMRVPVALRFLHALEAFSPMREGGNVVAFAELRKEAGGAPWLGDTGTLAAIELLGTWSLLVTAPIDGLDVRLALTRVAAWAHLTLVLQLSSARKPNGTSCFITPDLNFDVQISASAIFYHVATMIAVSMERGGRPTPALLYLEGSEKLEEKFATARRVRSTFSMEQVHEVLQSAADAGAIIARHPDWRRRDIRRDINDTKMGKRSDDHIGRADFDVQLVSAADAWWLPASWADGKKLAEEACVAAMRYKVVTADEATAMRVKPGAKVPAGVSFMAPGARACANMFVYVFKQLGVAGAHAKKTLVCPIVAGQPIGVKAVDESKGAAAKPDAADADGGVGVGSAPIAGAAPAAAALPAASAP